MRQHQSARRFALCPPWPARRSIPQADIEIAQLAPTFAMPTMSENGVSASVDQMSIFGHFYFIVERWSCRRRRCAGRRYTERSVGRDRRGMADADDVLWRSTEPVAVRPSLCGIASAAGCACRNSPFRRRTRRRSAWRRAHRAQQLARRACAPPTHRSQRVPPG